MAFKFTDAARYPYKSGGFFLGADDQGREVGITTERHLMTIAGAGSGKGAALLVPNLKRWKSSALVVDPKGENATLTAEARAAMGQIVGIVDPYQIVKGPAARFRVSVNPLAQLDPSSLHFRGDLEALADGMVMRHDPRHELFVHAARTMIGGAIDDMMTQGGAPETKTLPALRSMFLQPPEILREWAESMLADIPPSPARLARETGALLLEKLDSPESVPAKAFGSNLLPALGWIADPAFDDVWQGLPQFDLDDLKGGKGTLYLVLPPKMIGPRGTFLRLFVSMGLNTMMRDLAEETDARCLFLLDEFYSLGSLDIVAQAMGLMRGYGVQLWPYLQDLGQLRKLYGDDLTGTFFGNADAHIYFGNTDAQSLDYVSQRIGVVTQADIGAMPPVRSVVNHDPRLKAAAFDPVHPPRPMYTPTAPRPGQKVNVWGGVAQAMDVIAAADHQDKITLQARARLEIERIEKENAASDDNAMREYQRKMARKGEPHLKPSEIRELVGKRDGDKVARSMIVFAKGSDTLNIRLSPYFAPVTDRRPMPCDEIPSPATPAPPSPPITRQAWQYRRARNASLILFVVLALAAIWMSHNIELARDATPAMASAFFVAGAASIAFLFYRKCVEAIERG